MTDISMNICESKHNTNNTNPIDIFTRHSCFKIKQIVEDLEKKLATRYNVESLRSFTIPPKESVPAGVSGSVIDNSYRNWVGSLRQ